MGCWNGTCGITQLPIRRKDKVRCFILTNQNSEYMQSRMGGGICYPDDLWAPLSPGFLAEYDEYGGVDNIVETAVTKALLKKLRQDWFPVKNRFNEISSIDTNDSLADVVGKVAADESFIKPFASKQLQLGIFMIIEDIYQDLLKFNPVVRSYQSGKYIKFSESILEDLRAWYSQKQSAFAPGLPPDLTRLLREVDVGQLFSDRRNAFSTILRHALEELAKEQVPFEDDRVKEIVTSISEMATLCYAMQMSRKMWHPQAGAGSQQDKLDIYKIINISVNNFIVSREAGDIEEGYAIPDENGYYEFMLEHNAEIDNKK